MWRMMIKNNKWTCFVKDSAGNGSIVSVLDMLTNFNLIRVYVLCEQVSQVQGLKEIATSYSL